MCERWSFYIIIPVMVFELNSIEITDICISNYLIKYIYLSPEPRNYPLNGKMNYSQ